MRRSSALRVWVRGVIAAVRAVGVPIGVAIGVASVGVTGCAPTPTQAPAVHAQSEQLLPVGLRRLTNREFVRVAESLLNSPAGETPRWSVPAEIEHELPPDVRQEDGYTRNADQSMSAVLAVRIAELAHRLASAAVKARQQRLYPCGVESVNATADSCVHQFMRDMAERGYRRAVSEPEVAELVSLFTQASAQTGPQTSVEEQRSAAHTSTVLSRGAQAGVVVVLSAILQSPKLWYVSEGGSAQASAGLAVVQLSSDEIASQIAFVMRGAPPDRALLLAAREGDLLDPAEREQQARRLLGLADTRQHYRQFVLQWLEVDKLEQTAKSEAVFAKYEDFKPLMVAETERFADEVFAKHGASLRAMLTANFTAVDPKMAVFYGLSRFGARVSLAGSERLGVLQQASFLAAHSHADTTSPVLRGDFILRKVLCERLPRPSELDLEIVMPRPSENHTRREQFLRHGADPQCAQCHDQIDGFGFTMENFDAAGRARELELEQPVRTDGRVEFAGQSLQFTDSVALSQWLAEQPQAHECFARHAFRFVSGRHIPEVEDAFMRLRATLPTDKRENLLEHLVAYVRSDLFIQRRNYGAL